MHLHVEYYLLYCIFVHWFRKNPKEKSDEKSQHSWKQVVPHFEIFGFRKTGFLLAKNCKHHNYLRENTFLNMSK